MATTIRYKCYPLTDRPPEFVARLVTVFRSHEKRISTEVLEKGLKSDDVLGVLRGDLVALGFDVELGKRANEKIFRPVFFGENGSPTLQYEVDAYHEDWRCGLEIEAGRAWKGNAIYRDIVQGMVMGGVDTLVIAVSNVYKYRSGGKRASSPDYENTCRVADTIYGHSRFKLPYRLVVIGY